MSRYTLLLAEDNPDHALLTAEALEAVQGVDVDVETVCDGQEALDYLFRVPGYEDARTPSLVLLDIKMPAVDGFAVLRRLKADQRLRVIPVIMLTSSGDDRDIALSYELGSNSYVQKPVGASALFDRVSEIPSYWFGVNVPPGEGGVR